MARRKADFAILETGAPGKLATIEKQVSIINKRFPHRLPGYCIGIPGTGKQMQRHIIEYDKCGVPESRQIMVDHNEKVYNTQLQAAKELQYKGKLAYGDLMDVAKYLWDTGKQIDIIDYDGVSFLDEKHEAAIKLAAEHNVKVFVLVVTNRCNGLTPYLENWKKRLGIRKRIIRRDRGYTLPFGELQQGAIKAIAENQGYNVEFISYAGNGPPMLSCVLTQKEVRYYG